MRAGSNVNEHPWSRRSFLESLGVMGGSLFLPIHPLTRTSRANTLTGGAPVLTAMHVHGSWSEGGDGPGSWQGQFHQASQSGIDVMYMTDHDHRALATYYLTRLDSGVGWNRLTSGALSQNSATTGAGGFRLVAESAGSGPASVTLKVDEKTTAWNRLRTSIAGQSLTHAFGAVALPEAATYEIVIDLSYHPATGGRPAGAYQLRYRFGVTAGRYLEAGGLVGVVGFPAPASGSAVTFSIDQDVAALWPDMLALDNCFYNLMFTATSPLRGSTADVTVASVRFHRTQNNEADVIANQRTVIDTYSPQYPSLDVHPSDEISRLDPHLNVFGVPQFFPAQSQITSTTKDSFYQSMVANVHSSGGLASYNHPFGASGGPLASAAAQASKRQQVFQQMRAVNCYGCDIVEVGYTVRGKCSTQTHIDLWDTFSRDAKFLTGNGVNDDHQGGSRSNWNVIGNGFATGVWALSKAEADLIAALAAGRAYSVHPGRWSGGQLDMQVDGVVPMGAASISSQSSRSVAISAANVPVTGAVRLVAGPVDYKGAIDPGTVVLETIPASAFGVGGTGIVNRSIDTSASTFIRAQVLNAAGATIGIGNPIWLLKEQPPNGIPPSREAV